MSRLDQSIFHDARNRRLDILDKRFYFIEGGEKYYPSLTHIIKAGAPADPHLIKWFKQNGFNADRMLKEAGDFGTVIHDMIDRNLKGETIVMAQKNSDGSVTYNYTMEQWECFLKYVEFRKHIQRVIANEVKIISAFLNVGQTIDLVCEINGQRWIVDFKTSNYIHKDHFVQVAVNAYSWNEFYPELFIERVGLLHLKADTRGPDKKGKVVQGKGWQLVEQPRKHYKDFMPIFHRRYAEWLEENKDYKPAIYSLASQIDGFTMSAEIKTPNVLLTSDDIIEVDQIN